MRHVAHVGLTMSGPPADAHARSRTRTVPEEMLVDAQHHLPPITIATSDYNRLLVTAMIQQEHNRRTSEFLLEELRRAKVCHPSALPEDVVSTNCRVIFRLDDEARSRAHLLVHPEDLLWPGAEISVTTPLGTALLGLSVGDRMSFEDDGTVHEVFVEGIGLRFLDDGTRVTRTPGSIWWV
jgi:regulator of nucleoside diphosphate kinase